MSHVGREEGKINRVSAALKEVGSTCEKESFFCWPGKGKGALSLSLSLSGG